MKKILLGTSAFVAAGFVTVPALAQLNLTISGFYRFEAAYVDEDGDDITALSAVPNVGTVTTTTRDYDFSSRARIAFDATGTADNGLRYGARIRFQNGVFTNNRLDQYDQAFGFLEGNFGRLAFGDIEAAGTLLRVYAPDAAGTGIANGTWSNFTKGNTNFTQRVPGGAVGNTPGAEALVAPTGVGGFLFDRFGPNAGVLQFDDVINGSTNIRSYSTKLVYTTTGIPLYGFTFGVSYAPEIGNRGRNYDRNAAITGTGAAAVTNFEDAISVALQYVNTNIWNNLGLKAAGQYNFANSRAANVEDLQTWMIGAQFTFAGFTLGGHYIDNGTAGSATPTGQAVNSAAYFGTGVGYNSYTGWGAGVEYTIGPWTVGANYFTQTVSDLSPGVPFSDYGINAVGGGASYLVAPGLTVGADVVYYWEDIDQRAGFTNINENDGTVVAVRTQVTF